MFILTDRRRERHTQRQTQRHRDTEEEVKIHQNIDG